MSERKEEELELTCFRILLVDLKLSKLASKFLDSSACFAMRFLAMALGNMELSNDSCSCFCCTSVSSLCFVRTCEVERKEWKKVSMMVRLVRVSERLHLPEAASSG